MFTVAYNDGDKAINLIGQKDDVFSLALMLDKAGIYYQVIPVGALYSVKQQAFGWNGFKFWTL